MAGKGTPEPDWKQLEAISEGLEPLFQYLEEEVIKDIARRIQKSLTYTRTAELQAMSMKKLGYSPAWIRKEAVKILKADAEYRKQAAKNTLEYKGEVRNLINEIAKEAYKAGNEIVAGVGDVAWISDLSVRTGCRQLAGKVMDKNIEQSGKNLVYVDKHNGACNTGTGRVNHEKWQGKVRAMERGIRVLKLEKKRLEVLGMDTTEIKAKIKRKTAEYKKFCGICDIRPKTERLRYECGTSDLKKTEAWKQYEKCRESVEKDVADIEPHGRIKETKEEKGVEVHTVGKLDKEIYKCITDDIVTDEVIITDERIVHIKERHPNDYERFYSYISDIITEPDYIIKANKPDTATVLKEIVDNGEKFQLVLRLKTSQDKPEFKNSIITFLNINERTWNKYLRNKEILYRRE